MRRSGHVPLAHVCALVLFATSALPANAQQKPGEARAGSVTCAADDTASARSVAKIYEEAYAEYRKEHYATAYCGFLAALARERTPQILGNLGRVEMKLGKDPDAAEHLSAFLREEVPAADRAEVTRLLAQVEAKIGTLRIEVTAPGAEVFLDGARIGTAPLPREVYVSPGHHVIEARLGQARSSKAIDAAAGSAVAVTLGMPAIAPQTAMLPGGTVAGPAAQTPGQDAGISAKASARRTAFVAATLGVGAVALGVGIGTGVAALSKKDDAKSCLGRGDEAHQRDCWASAERDRASLARGATAGFVIGGAAVTAGVLGYFLWPSEKPRKGPTVSVGAGPGGAGLVVSGSW